MSNSFSFPPERVTGLELSKCSLSMGTIHDVLWSAIEKGNPLVGQDIACGDDCHMDPSVPAGSVADYSSRNAIESSPKGSHLGGFRLMRIESRSL